MKTQLLVAVLALAIAGQAYAQGKSAPKRTHEVEKKEAAQGAKTHEVANRNRQIADGFKDLVGGESTIKLILDSAASRGKEAEMLQALKSLKETLADAKISEAQKKEVVEFLQNLVEYSSTATAEQATTIELMIKSLPAVLKKGGAAAESWTAKLKSFNVLSQSRTPVGEALDKSISKEEQAKIRKECV